MCEKCFNTDVPDQSVKKTPKLRQKIWDLEGRFHCSVIGTCLSLKELDKLIRKADISGWSGATDYDKHCFFVDIVAKPSNIAKHISKMLDKKYKTEINAAKKLLSLDEMLIFWKNCLDQGSVSGGYWALLTHPDTNQQLRYMLYGDVHMLSHIEGFAFRKERRQYKHMSGQMKNLEQSLEREIKQRKKLSHQKTTLKSELDIALAEIVILKNQIHVAKDNIRLLEKREEKQRSDAEDTKQVVALTKRIDVLEYINTDLQKRSDKLSSCLFDMEQDKNEIESALQLALAQCEGGDVKQPDKIDLKGKTVIYLGGPRQKQIQRFKSFVETGNGQFIHHDGGQEDGDGRLTEVLCKGDVVMCPIDCISHQACLKAKKICKFQGKNFVPLRSSGISSFMTELEKINFVEDDSVK